MTAPSSIDPARFLHDQLASASPDLLRSMLTTFVNTLMSAEADAICGAPYGMPGPDRVNVRNGYRHRDSGTRAGTLDVAIPKLRQGSYFPDWLLERRRRAEGARHHALPGKCGRAACAWAAACRPPIHCSRRSRPLRRPGPSCTRSRTSGPTCHPRSMSFYDTCVAPRYRNGPTGRRRLTGAEAFELEGMDPCYIDIDGFWPQGADSKGPEGVPIAN